MTKFIRVFIIIQFVFVSVYAQKTKFKDHEFILPFKKTKVFEGVKTFTYEIQDDGDYWNHSYENGENTDPLASYTKGLKIEGLEQVKENGDIRIVVGFLGNELYIETGWGMRLKGTMNIMIVKDDVVLFSALEDISANTISYKESGYSLNDSFLRNKAKAELLTEKVQDYFNIVKCVITGKAKHKLAFGFFRKTKKNELAKQFTEKAQFFLEKFKNNPSAEVISEANEFFKGQLVADFGEKLKEKRKFRVILNNLILTSLLLGEFDKAEEYAVELDKYLPRFNSYKYEYSKYKKINTLFDTEAKGFHILKSSKNFTYRMKLGEGVLNTGKKDISFSIATIDRFKSRVESSSGMSSLSLKDAPKVNVFEAGSIKGRYMGNGKTTLKLKNGDTIYFKAVNSLYRPYLKSKGTEQIMY